MKQKSLLLIYLIIFTALQNLVAQVTYPSNSVLSSGHWYKIRIASDGVYKLSYSDFISMGFTEEEINWDNLSIYGNGGLAISEKNSEYKHSDLQENAIYVNKTGRYALFYAQGTTKTIYKTDSSFSFEVHPYSDYASYFVTFDSSIGTKKRIEEKTLSNTYDTTISTTPYYSFHKRELTNLLNAGKTWVGERMTPSSNTLSVPINLLNISPDYPAQIELDLATASASNVSFVVKLNNTQLENMYPSATSSSDIVALKVNKKYQQNISVPNSTINIQYNSANFSDKAYLNYILVNYKQNLILNNSYLRFFSINNPSLANSIRYQISNAPNVNTMIWDVTDINNAYMCNKTQENNNIFCIIPNDTIRTIVVVNGSNFATPIFVNQVENQNLHAMQPADLIIVSNTKFLSSADELATLHRQNDGISVEVVDVEQVYNEFSSGQKDFLAIREFLRMMYNKYVSEGKNPKNVLLFGDGTFDNKNILGYNNNYIPTYQSVSEYRNVGYVFTSDDVLACLSDYSENRTYDTLMIGVGRFPVNEIKEAEILVDKAKRYMSKQDLLENEDGDWRNFVMLSSDDADDLSEMYFIDNAEHIYTQIDQTQPYINIQKVYQDAYKEYTSSSGATYPDASKAINDRINKGCLLFNYLGHGSPDHLSGERLITMSDITSWTNYNKLPLMITSTCEFARFDLVDKQAAGEYAVLSENGAAIALIAAARKIASNNAINQALHKYALMRKTDGTPYTFGEVMMNAKNATNLQTAERSITLLGDPALRISLPKYNIKTTQINNSFYDDSISGFATIDTSNALSKMYIRAEVVDFNGNKIQDFNGKVKIYLFDKKTTYQTLDNAGIGRTLTFELQTNLLHKGFAQVSNGEFEYNFIIPKDIAYNYGRAKLSFYAQDGSVDAAGYTNDFVLGGINENVDTIETRPIVDLYINDSNFVDYGITDENPTLFAVIKDSIPINIAGAGLGHDIVARLDNAANTFILNDYYVYDDQDVTKGYIIYPFSSLEEGEHTLSIKVWNIYNYSSDATIHFKVVNSGKEEYETYNYPNPFSDGTNIILKFNQANDVKSATIKIFNAQGRILKTINADEYINTYNLTPIHWDGRVDGGGMIGNGIYYYVVEIVTNNGDKIRKMNKMLVIK